MKRFGFGSVVFAVFVLLASPGCGDDDSSGDDDGIVLFDAAPPDAPPPPDAAPDFDAQLFDYEPGIGIDDMNLVGRNPLFATLGSTLVNSQVDMMIGSGGLTLAIGLGGLDDPSGQADDAVRVALYSTRDPDGNPANNFDETAPDSWIVTADNFGAGGEPNIAFDGSIVDGRLTASSNDSFSLPGSPFPFPIHSPNLDGVLVPNGDSTAIDFLQDGVVGKGIEVTAQINGAILIETLGPTPNFVSMFGCTGDNLLDVLTQGCSAVGLSEGVQPDVDQDGDGLESLCDECSDPACADAPVATGATPDAAAGDGIISCCVDGDRTTVDIGIGCWDDAKFADGFLIELTVHGTRVLLQTEAPMN